MGEGLSMPMVRLLHFGDAEGSVPVRARVDRSTLRRENILSTSRDFVLVDICGGNPGFYRSCPSLRSRVYEHIATPLPPAVRNRQQEKTNSMGRFAYIPSAVNEGTAFYSYADPVTRVTRSYNGIKFPKKSNLFISVNLMVFNVDHWDTISSPHVNSPSNHLFLNTHPYCILQGDFIFMAYIVGYVLIYNTTGRKWYVEEVPEVSSCHDYTFMRHTAGIVGLLSYRLGMLKTWLLRRNGDEFLWICVRSLDLTLAMVAFNSKAMLAKMKLERTEADDPYFEFCSAQIRSCSDTGIYVLFTLGFDPTRIYIANMITSTVHEVETDPDEHVEADSTMVSAKPLMEEWPPYMRGVRIRT